MEVTTPPFWDLTPRQSWTRQSLDANPKALENPKLAQKDSSDYPKMVFHSDQYPKASQALFLLTHVSCPET